MNKQFKFTTLFFSCMLALAGCSENNDSFKTPDSSASPDNNNPVSQKNITILSDPVSPAFFDVVAGTFTATTAQVSVQIGDNENRNITAGRTVFFRTEWGLIDPSCTTADGTCSVTWRSTSVSNMPSNFLNNILAYIPGGQETFIDSNGNGMFNDSETFTDNEEPYVDVNDNGTFDTGDLIVDTINGLDLTGADAMHNAADGLYNGPNCSHSTLCSTALPNATVWINGSFRLTGDTTFTIGGSITGTLPGTLVLSNNGEQLSITTGTSFNFTIAQKPGQTYNVTIVTNPGGCSISNNTGTVFNTNVTTVAVAC